MAGDRTGRSRSRGVSFGMSGTNAHVILEQALPSQSRGRASRARRGADAGEVVSAGSAVGLNVGRRERWMRTSWPGSAGLSGPRCVDVAGSRWPRPGRCSSTARCCSPPTPTRQPEGVATLDGTGAVRGVADPAGSRMAVLFPGQGAFSGWGWAGSCADAVPGVRGGVRRGVRGAGWGASGCRPVAGGGGVEASRAATFAGLLDGHRVQRSPRCSRCGVALFRGCSKPRGGCGRISWPGIRSVSWPRRMSPGCCRCRMRARWWWRGAG